MNNNENMNQNQETQNNSGFAENIGRKLDKGLADTSEALKNNENVQKAFSAASDAGKKLDEGLTNAAQNIKNSEQYHKIMQNENVQKVMQNEHVQKAGTLWNGFSKKTKYIIGAVLLLLILLLIFSGTGGKSTVTVEPVNYLDAMQCPDSCKAGRIGFCKFQGIYTLYFSAADYSKVYLLECEDGSGVEVIAEESSIYGRESSNYNYDNRLMNCHDLDGDGYIEYTISVYTGRDYKKICTVKGKTED